jgi:hypothetical protein
VSATAGQPSFHPSKEAYNDMPEFPMCRNIDEALHSFRVEGDFPKYGVVDEYDWILDGRKEDDYHSRRSQELIQELKVPNVEEIVLIRDIIWEASQRELQFASFPQEEEEEDFGDFQVADACEEPSATSNNRLDGMEVVNREDIIDGDAGEEEKKNDSERSFAELQGVDGALDQTSDKLGVNMPDQIGDHEDEEEDDDPDAISIPMEVKVTFTECDHSLDILSCSSHEDEGSKEVNEWDLTTPEGRFLRRQMPEQLPTPISLPQHFFQEADSTTLCEAVVRSIPWKHVPFVQKDFSDTSTSEHDMAVVEEHLMCQLMQLDGWLASVTTQSLQQISFHKNSLELCNHHLRELNHSLAMADMFAQQSKKSLTEARGDECTGLTSAMVLLEAWDQRDVYRDLDSLLTNSAHLLDQETHLKQKIKAFGQDTSRVEEIVDAAKTFSENAHDQQLSRLTALDDVRDRAVHILGTFAREIESLVINLVAGACVSWKKFCPTKYVDCLNAMVRIHQKVDQQKTVSETWSQCIIDTLLFEADKCLARALLNPTNCGESVHDKELLTLEYALKDGHGDYAKLKTVSHNLVTIRFDFEASQQYFPLVFHRLCQLLTEVLHCHFAIVRWHKSNDDHNKETHTKVRRQLLKSRVKVWKRCEQVLGACMDEYINFASKTKLFAGKSDESTWINDLEAMHDVMQLTQQLCIIGKEFLGKDAKHKVTCLSDEACETALRSKLCSVQRKHLRAVHVESMNSMGSMLSKETWQLVPMHPVENGLTGFSSSETELKDYLTKLVDDFIVISQASSSRGLKVWESRMRESKDPVFLSFAEHGNPFDVLPSRQRKEKRGFNDFDHQQRDRLEWAQTIRTTEGISPRVYELVAALVENNLTEESRIAIETCFAGFAKCAARLLLVMKKLPLILPDVAKVIQNVSDLFLATVFRLCTGNSINENIILGVESAKRYTMEFPVGKRKNSAPLIGFGRRSFPEGPTRPQQPITSRLEAEICSPLHCDKKDADLLRSFIRRAQLSLEGMVKLDMVQGWIGDPVGIAPEESDDEYLCRVYTCLEKRQSASWSCLFVAATLDLVKNFAVTKLTRGALASMLGESPDEFHTNPLGGVAYLVDYVDSVLHVVPIMIQFSSRMASARAIGSRRMVEEICRTAWDTSQLSESSHYYVELVGGRYAFLWRFLSTSAKLPIGVRRHAWESLVAIGYATFLEGFARVPYCSTEGRSSMSIDLAAFGAAVSPSSIQQLMDNDCIPRPPTTATQARGRQYVDTYIKVSYLPQEDIMKWIATNFSEYHLNHIIALTGGRTDMIKYVQSLYEDEGGNVEI